MDYVIMCITYLRFHAGCKAQGLDRKSLPYVGYFQPYCAYIGLAWTTLIIFFYGYPSFKGGFQVKYFFYSYTMPILDIILFTFWKFFKKTRWLRAHEMDLVWERPTIDA